MADIKAFAQYQSDEFLSNRLPAVSVGLPVYNGEKYLKTALDSLLNQTFTDFELIISDNASTDGTGEICQEYAKKDDRIRYVLQSGNIGPLANFQFVLTEAQGKYFMWAAHDDSWDLTFLELTVAKLESDEQCGLVFSHYIVRDLESNKEKLQKVMPSNSKSAVMNYLIRTLNMCPSLIYGLFRIEKIKDITFTTNFDFADVHFVSQLALVSHVEILDDYLYIAGTKGVRKPYSFTHKKINRKTFLLEQFRMLIKHFHFPISYCLFMLVCLVMVYNKVRLWRY